MTAKKNNPTESPPNRQGSRKIKRFLLGSLLLILVLGGGFTAYAFYYSHRVLPHTVVAGLSVGGLSLADAGAALAQKEKDFSSSQLDLSYQTKHWSLPAKQLDLHFQDQNTLAQAYAVGHSGDFSQQLRDLLTALFVPQYFETDLASITPTGKKALEKAVLNEIETPTAETNLNILASKVDIIPGKAGEQLDYQDFEEQLYLDFKNQSPTVNLNLAAFQPQVTEAEAEVAQRQAQQILAAPWILTANNQTLTFTPADLAGLLSTSLTKDGNGQVTGLTLSIDETALTNRLTTFAGQVNIAPVNATLKADSNGNVTVDQPSRAGLQVQLGPTLQELKQAWLGQDLSGANLKRTLAAVTSVQQPTLTTDSLSQLGLSKLIGTATTDFTGSPANRTFNIGLGVKSITGTVVNNGDTFSTVKTLGPIDEAHGYLPELVILNNKTLPEPGGGLCQVSTTLFRSVLNAGLPVVSRTNHAYRVRYYEGGVGPGLDATVYDPQPDFSWKNDTGHAIYIQGSIKDKKLTFELYGTPDGRTVGIDGPHTLQTFSPSSTPQYVNTDTLPKGKTVLIDPPVPGARTTATYTVTRGGQVINQQTFNSYYTAMPAQYLVGTK